MEAAMPGSLIASSEAPLIVGLGDTGVSCVRYFQRRGIPCAAVDSREMPPGLPILEAEFPELPLSLGPLDPEQLRAAGRLVVSPGISLDDPAVAAAREAGVPVCGDIDLFCEAAAAPVVGITGSNGKSTVTELLGRMAARSGRRVAVGGNLGTPALDLLDDSRELYILELSSFQLERADELGLSLATVLNISADHMDRHGSLPRYHLAKHRVFRGCRAVVFNRDDPLSRPLQSDNVTSWTFGLGVPDRRGYGLAANEGEPWLYREFQPLMPAKAVRLVGRHNLANALASLALAELLELPIEECLAELEEFPGLAHRCQLVGETGGVRFINDSKATNPGATLAAIEGLRDGGRLVLILGGQGKGADFGELCRRVSAVCDAAVLIGESAAELDSMLAPGFPRQHAGSMEEAVARAFQLVGPGGLVLLSPACASFDMFRGFSHRGEVFAAAVAGICEVPENG
jgi:UDP-N-acetylmuramoylalanine--D-glutamate ligase